MSSLSQSLAYIGMLLEHHPRYEGKSFTLTQINGQFFIQTRKYNGRSPNDLCGLSRSDLEDGLTPKQWNNISQKIARRIAKRERWFKNGIETDQNFNPIDGKQNRTQNPR